LQQNEYTKYVQTKPTTKRNRTKKTIRIIHQNNKSTASSRRPTKKFTLKNSVEALQTTIIQTAKTNRL